MMNVSRNLFGFGQDNDSVFVPPFENLTSDTLPQQILPDGTVEPAGEEVEDFSQKPPPDVIREEEEAVVRQEEAEIMKEQEAVEQEIAKEQEVIEEEVNKIDNTIGILKEEKEEIEKAIEKEEIEKESTKIIINELESDKTRSSIQMRERAQIELNNDAEKSQREIDNTALVILNQQVPSNQKSSIDKLRETEQALQRALDEKSNALENQIKDLEDKYNDTINISIQQSETRINNDRRKTRQNLMQLKDKERKQIIPVKSEIDKRIVENITNLVPLSGITKDIINNKVKIETYPQPLINYERRLDDVNTKIEILEEDKRKLKDLINRRKEILEEDKMRIRELIHRRKRDFTTDNVRRYQTNLELNRGDRNVRQSFINELEKERAEIKARREKEAQEKLSTRRPSVVTGEVIPSVRPASPVRSSRRPSVVTEEVIPSVRPSSPIQSPSRQLVAQPSVLDQRISPSSRIPSTRKPSIRELSSMESSVRPSIRELSSMEPSIRDQLAMVPSTRFPSIRESTRFPSTRDELVNLQPSIVPSSRTRRTSMSPVREEVYRMGNDDLDKRKDKVFVYSDRFNDPEFVANLIMKGNGVYWFEGIEDNPIHIMDFLMSYCNDTYILILLDRLGVGGLRDTKDIIYNYLWYVVISKNKPVISQSKLYNISSMSREQLLREVPANYSGSTDRATLLYNIAYRRNLINDTQKNPDSNRILDFAPATIWSLAKIFGLIKDDNLVCETNFETNSPYQEVIEHLFIENDPIRRNIKGKVSSKVFELISQLDPSNWRDISQEYGIVFPNNFSGDYLEYILNELLQYDNIISRPRNIRAPTNDNLKSRDPIASLSMYTLGEIVGSFDRSRSINWINRVDLIDKLSS